MSIIDDARAQLVDELGQRVRALVAAVRPDMAIEVDRWAATSAECLAELLASDDDAQAAETVIDVMAALWPDPVEPPPEWWRTPVGRLCARSAGTGRAQAVTHSMAAAMLGIPRDRVGNWVRSGKLDRHPDGGVLRSSIMQRLAGGL